MGTFRPTARLTASLLAVAAVLAGLAVLAFPEPGASVVARRVLCAVTEDQQVDELTTELRRVLADRDLAPVRRVGSCRHGADVAVETSFELPTTPGAQRRTRTGYREVERILVAHGWVDDPVLQSGDGRHQVSISISPHRHGPAEPGETVTATVLIHRTGHTHYGVID
jgi:hypothetical protein